MLEMAIMVVIGLMNILQKSVVGMGGGDWIEFNSN